MGPDANGLRRASWPGAPAGNQTGLSEFISLAPRFGGGVKFCVTGEVYDPPFLDDVRCAGGPCRRGHYLDRKGVSR